jgi:hypothetical protein
MFHHTNTHRANECLKQLQVRKNDQLVSVANVISFFEIYPGKYDRQTTIFCETNNSHTHNSTFSLFLYSKKSHFKRLQIDSGLEYSEMVFFDNEFRNVKDVQQLVMPITITKQ